MTPHARAASDVVAIDAEALAQSIAFVLHDLRPLAATELAAAWAISSDPVRRLAIACALRYPFALFGDELILDHLIRDRDPDVREAAARAAQARREPGFVRYGPVPIAKPSTAP